MRLEEGVPHSVTHPFPGTFRPSSFTASKRKAELGSERKSGWRGVGERVIPNDGRRYCVLGLLHTAVATVHTAFSQPS